MEQFRDPSQWRSFNRGPLTEPDEAETSRGEGGESLVTEIKGDRSGLFGWESPEWPEQPGRYYHLTLRCRSDVYAHWEAQFYNEDGTTDDFHTAGIPSTGGEWRRFEYYFAGKCLKSVARMIIWPSGPGRMEVADLALEPAEDEDAWRWFASFMDALPPLPPTEGKRGTLLAGTIGKLRAAERPLNIATYGDSLAFDVGNLPLDLALERAYPGAEVHMHTRGKGGTGWAKLRAPDVLSERLLAAEPDLVITFALSNLPHEVAPGLEAIVDRTRAACDAEFLLVTNHRPDDEDVTRDCPRRFERLAEATRAVGERKGAEVADLRALLAAWLPGNPPPANELAWFMRDSCHLNEFGRALVLRLFLAHLAPEVGG